MCFRDTTESLKRKARSFVTIREDEYFVEDWLRRSDGGKDERPLVIKTVFSDNGQRFVVIRDESFKRTIYSLEEFIQNIEGGMWIHMPKPKYHTGQVFKNKYTERLFRIIDVPYAPNDCDGEYTYFVRDTSPTYGRNFTSITEKELDALFKQEGMDIC